MALMVLSSVDDVALCEAVETRFKDLCGAYERIRGTQLMIPTSLDNDFFRWRQMAVRHKQGDFRHNEAEMKSLRTIAQWLVDTNCELRNQPRTEIDWEARYV